MSPDTATVLIAEDNPLTRKLLRVSVEAGGYSVVEAGDGASALRLLQENAPDLVIQDLGLPDMDGLALLEQIRDRESGARLPVVAVSGLEAKLVAAPAGGLGFASRLLKPVGPAELLSTVQGLLGVDEPDTRGELALRTALVVDDDRQRGELFSARLEAAGLSGALVASGAEALAALESRRPELVVSEAFLPGIDGFELARAIRGRDRTASVPVLLVSNDYVEEPDRVLARTCGACDLVRPDGAGGELARALEAALASGPVPLQGDPASFEREHTLRLRAQLERQVTQNRRLVRETDARTVPVSIIAGVSAALRGPGKVADVLEEVLNRCEEIEAIDSAAVIIADLDSGVLQTAAAVGPLAGCDTRRLGKLAIVAEAVAERRQGVASADRPPRNGTRAVLEQTGLTSMLIEPLVSGGEAIGALAIGSRGELDAGHVSFAHAIGAQIAEAIELARTLSELTRAREQTILRLARAAEFRDDDTAQHTQRMSLFCALLAERAGVAEERRELIRVAALMHDIGKLGVPDRILFKPGKLTAHEFESMKQHAEYGHRILSGSDEPLLELAATIALCHHERIDGRGYPQGLAGDRIPLEARIAAIADVFDALTSDRPYRPAFSVEEAIEIMAEERGTHFDPQLFDLFLEAIPDALIVRETYSDAQA